MDTFHNKLDKFIFFKKNPVRDLVCEHSPITFFHDCPGLVLMYC